MRVNMGFMNNDFPAEEFDIVMMVEVLEHIKNDSRAFKRYIGFSKRMEFSLYPCRIQVKS